MEPGRPATIEVNGKAWTFGRMTLGVILSFRDWVAQKIGDPFEVPERFIQHLSEKEALNMIREAKQVKEELDSFSFDSELCKRFFKTPEGMMELTRLLLQKHHPEVTTDDVFELMAAVDPAELSRVLGVIEGARPGDRKAPEGKAGNFPDRAGRTSPGG